MFDLNQRRSPSPYYIAISDGGGTRFPESNHRLCGNGTELAVGDRQLGVTQASETGGPMKFTNPEERRDLINGWIWLCPILAIALAAWLLVMWGFTWWTALLIALFLVCPAILYGASSKSVERTVSKVKRMLFRSGLVDARAAAVIVWSAFSAAGRFCVPTCGFYGAPAAPGSG